MENQGYEEKGRSNSVRFARQRTWCGLVQQISIFMQKQVVSSIYPNKKAFTARPLNAFF